MNRGGRAGLRGVEGSANKKSPPKPPPGGGGLKNQEVSELIGDSKQCRPRQKKKVSIGDPHGKGDWEGQENMSRKVRNQFWGGSKRG